MDKLAQLKELRTTLIAAWAMAEDGPVANTLWGLTTRIYTQIEAIQRQQIDDIAAQLRNGKPTN